MGSYENIVKIEEMRKRLEEGDAASAQKVLDTMDIKKIKNMSDLSLIAEVNAENERYEEAARLFLKIYEKTRSRKSLFYLVELSIKMGKMEDARYYLEEYQKLAPRDFYKYIFRYRIELLSNEPFETLIETLETLKKTEYMEQWAYELAKTYYRAGMEKECIRECSDIILWFGEGVYVEKAKILRSYFSDGADKQKIIENLKRRAQEEAGQDGGRGKSDTEQGHAADIHKTEENAAAEEMSFFETTEEEPASQQEREQQNKTDVQDETLWQDSAGLEDVLRRDIQSMMAEEDYLGEEPELSEENYLSEESEPEEEGYSGEKAELSEKEYSGGESELPEEETSARESNLTQGGNFAGETELTEEAYFDEETELTEEAAYFSGKSYIAGEAELAGSSELGTEQELREEDEWNEEAVPEESNEEEDDKKLNQLSQSLGFDLGEIFYDFLHVKSIKRQLIKSLEGILNSRAKTVQMIITGTAGTGKTALAKEITMFLYRAGKLKSSRIAKIDAGKLNTIDIRSKKETLRDCCLVIENASELKRETIDGILELCRILRGNIAVVLEENKSNINKLFRVYPKLMDLFKNRIHLPGYTPRDWMGFAGIALERQGYQLSEKAEALLYHKINQIAGQPEATLNLTQIQKLMQTATHAADVRAERPSDAPTARNASSEIEMLTILPEDFIGNA